MFFRNKLRRRPQANTTPVQALESRALMTGTGGVIGALQPTARPEPVVSAPVINYSKGQLKVTGTSGNDNVSIKVWDRTFLPGSSTPSFNLLEVKVNNTTRYYSSSALTGIDVSTLGGNDSVVIDSQTPRQLTSIKIDTGHGVSEHTGVINMRTRDLSVSSKGTVSNNVFVGGSTVSGNLSIDTSRSTVWAPSFGGYLNFVGNTAKDKITLDGVVVNQAIVTAGQGDDLLTVRRSRVDNGILNMQEGNDQVDLQSSELAYTVAAGGSGYDTYNSHSTTHLGLKIGFENFTAYPESFYGGPRDDDFNNHPPVPDDRDGGK